MQVQLLLPPIPENRHKNLENTEIRLDLVTRAVDICSVHLNPLEGCFPSGFTSQKVLLGGHGGAETLWKGRLWLILAKS